MKIIFYIATGYTSCHFVEALAQQWQFVKFYVYPINK